MDRHLKNRLAPPEIMPALKLPKFLRAQTQSKAGNILKRRPVGASGLFRTGFTILELVVVSSIIGIVASVALANFSQIRKSQALNRATQKLAFDIRRAQTLALGGVALGPPGGPPPRNICAYGISIQNPTTYLIFGNRYLGGNICGGQYNTSGANADMIVDSTAIALENNITITSGAIDIAFRPPQPTILVSGGSLPATITLSDGSNKRCITIAPTSQVSIMQGAVCP